MDVQITIFAHKGPLLRNCVKYSQCGMAPSQFQNRWLAVVQRTTSPVVPDT